MFGDFFKPYDEYELSSTLSAEELTERLCHESLKNPSSPEFMEAFRNTQNFSAWHLLEKQPEIVLSPIGRLRNSLRGILHCSIRDDEGQGGSVIHIVLKPADSRRFCCFFLGFLSIMTVFMISVRQYMVLLPSTVILFGFWAILYFCRHMSEQEVPMIKDSFEAFVRRLENEADTEKSDLGEVEDALPRKNYRKVILSCLFSALLLFVLFHVSRLAMAVLEKSYTIYAIENIRVVGRALVSYKEKNGEFPPAENMEELLTILDLQDTRFKRSNPTVLQFQYNPTTTEETPWLCLWQAHEKWGIFRFLLPNYKVHEHDMLILWDDSTVSYQSCGRSLEDAVRKREKELELREKRLRLKGESPQNGSP